MVEKKLQLVILAQAILDTLCYKLYNPVSDTDDAIDEAEAFVLRYPTVAKRLQSISSREDLEEWVAEIEKAMGR